MNGSFLYEMHLITLNNYYIPTSTVLLVVACNIDTPITHLAVSTLSLIKLDLAPYRK